MGIREGRRGKGGGWWGCGLFLSGLTSIRVRKTCRATTRLNHTALTVQPNVLASWAFVSRETCRLLPPEEKRVCGGWGVWRRKKKYSELPGPHPTMQGEPVCLGETPPKKNHEARATFKGKTSPKSAYEHSCQEAMVSSNPHLVEW